MPLNVDAAIVTNISEGLKLLYAQLNEEDRKALTNDLLALWKKYEPLANSLKESK